MYLALLRNNLHHGTLHLHLPDGTSHSFGTGEPVANWHIQQDGVIQRIARDWEFELGETYMRGGWHAGETGLHALLAVLRRNFSVYQPNPWLKPFQRMLREWNKVARSYANVSHHYDVSEAVFRRFLDTEMYYSCAYYAEPDYTLEQAQQAKARHIAGKLLIKPGNRILDIGCGWGSLAFHLASHYDCEVVGITLSREQLAVAQREQQRRGLTNVRFELADYREHSGSYDRIVSVGMFEHVGRPNYNTYFKTVKALLAPDGVALVHTIGRSGPPGITNPWIHKYIFPGGSNPSLSEVSAAVESSALCTTDLEVWRLHYACTLNHWYQRFVAHRDEISAEIDATFFRMWEFYLASCEAAFRYSDLVVFQVQLAHGHGPVPVTRDYLYK